MTVAPGASTRECNGSESRSDLNSTAKPCPAAARAGFGRMTTLQSTPGKGFDNQRVKVRIVTVKPVLPNEENLATI